MGDVLEHRRKQSDQGLALVRSEVDKRVAPLVGDLPLSIYVTGSFGRREARYRSGDAEGNSDLDLFFLVSPTREQEDRYQDEHGREMRIPKLDWFKIVAELIEIAHVLDFPEFSRDGVFLEAHNLWRVREQLGSRHEDADNGFTARLLLLLESDYVLGEELHRDSLERMLGAYFGDHAPHREDFRPYFLINDILRFWRTMCLNYEQKRTRRRSESNTLAGQTEWRIESAIDNLKLRFSRLATCYSMVAALAATPAVTVERVVDLCTMTPTERWDVAASTSTEAHALVVRIVSLYESFLEQTADRSALRAELGEHEDRKKARDHADAFGTCVAELLQLTADPAQLRMLLV